MPDTTTPATPAPESTPEKAKRAKPGLISKAILDAIHDAEDYRNEAAKPENTAPLAEREWDAAHQTDLSAHITSTNGYVTQITAARAGKGSSTLDEAAARTKLERALTPIQIGARRTFSGDPAQKKAFGIGSGLTTQSLDDLIALAVYADSQLSSKEGQPVKVKLKGVNAIATLAAEYGQADTMQSDAQQKAAELLVLLNDLVTTKLNPLRRDLQQAADMAWPHYVETNAVKRAAFGLQADRPLA